MPYRVRLPQQTKATPTTGRFLYHSQTGDSGGTGDCDGVSERRELDQELDAIPAPAECPPLPAGVKLVRYEPKDPPVAIAPVSIVTDVDKFIRAYLRDLAHRIQRPGTHACAPLPEILAKLAEVGLELTLETR